MEELISQALQEDMHIVVLALYVLGTVLKRIKAVPDCLISVFLAGIGMVLGYLVKGGVQGVMQGILASGAAVMCNQVIKQMKRPKRKSRHRKSKRNKGPPIGRLFHIKNERHCRL